MDRIINEAVFDGIQMDVIPIRIQFGFIADTMLPISWLPGTAVVMLLAVLADRDVRSTIGQIGLREKVLNDWFFAEFRDTNSCMQ
jgi:hypothetical protein